jgi:hypothetical protein
MYKETRGSSSNFVNLFHEFIPFIPFVHAVLLVFLLLCAMEKGDNCMCSANRTCLLHGDLQKVSVFSFRSVLISALA